jgi:hypothetical protein
MQKAIDGGPVAVKILGSEITATFIGNLPRRDDVVAVYPLHQNPSRWC